MQGLFNLAFAVVVTGLFMGPAWAQGADPRILLIFDTSGSMGVDIETNLEVGGDNSREYPGNGGTSRLWIAKQSVSTLVETTSEAQFGLMRYPQLEGDGINRGAADGFNQNYYEGLADTPLNYRGTCTGTLRAADPETGYSLIVPFQEDNEGDVISWLNNFEEWPMDRELRATGPTPLVESLRLAESYFSEIMPIDPGVRCRTHSIVLLTDGSESCVNRDTEAALNAQIERLRSIRVRLGREEVIKDVRVFVLGFAVNQQAEAQLTAIARAGGTAVNRFGSVDPITGDAYYADDPNGLRDAFSRILRNAIPTESCNGEDDDCDGEIDEGLVNSCGECGPQPEEVCNTLDDDCDDRIDEGALNACGGCGPVPAEICNEIDDDCDGRVDEAVVNACGGCAGLSEETCNGIDDDCDGRIDNLSGTAEPLHRPCSRDVGACQSGLSRCVLGQWGPCDGVLPTEEACNSSDDDCDGLVDEDSLACGVAQEVGEVGECQLGIRRCDPAACAADPSLCEADGWLSACENAIGPEAEFCDGRDNDCDGEADEGLFNACGQCGDTPPEACNGIDDNCDGRIDEDAQCPRGYLCFVGECVLPCSTAGECTPGLTCVRVYPGQQVCHPSPCDARGCPQGQSCNRESSSCENPCLGVECAPGQSCDLGACVPSTCRHTGCAEGQRCVGEACVPDPCFDADCEVEQFCREGECIDACRRGTCDIGQQCVDGDCVDDPCEGRCLRGTLCDPTDGRCVRDPCVGVDCPLGMVCAGGECTADAPCVSIVCPAGTVCRAGGCTDLSPSGRVDEPPAPPPPPPVVDAGRPMDAGPAEQDSGRDARLAAPMTTPEASEPDAGCNTLPQQKPGAPVWTLTLLVFLLSRRRR